MGNDVAIRVEGLGKCYRLGERSAPYRTLRETIMGLGRSLGRRRSREDTIWALKDVDLEVRRGEVLGVIGRNGAGKTTLLKILSRITEPTTGRVELHGRVGSLLEVGTGFHPELTGRENIYLNGAILGMRKAEIARKFDEIVAFAEVERFLDTPVKHYSSGMYVRLAFAVAAHLEPEILLVDEVLAVGDAAFQKKCMGKMARVSREGRTVLFVSHNATAVTRLCGRALCLERGGVSRLGEVQTVVGDYLQRTAGGGATRAWEEDAAAPGTGAFRLKAVAVVVGDTASNVIDADHGFVIRVQYDILRRMDKLRVCVRVAAADGGVVFQSCERPRRGASSKQPGLYSSECVVPGKLLNEGRFHVSVTADEPFVQVHLVEEDVVSFTVAGARTDQRPERWPGVVCPELEWRVRCSEVTDALAEEGGTL